MTGADTCNTATCSYSAMIVNMDLSEALQPTSSSGHSMKVIDVSWDDSDFAYDSAAIKS
jgi:hypothetical protein